MMATALATSATTPNPMRRYRCDNPSRARLALETVTPTVLNGAMLAAATTS